MKAKLFVVLSFLALASLLVGASSAQGPGPQVPPPPSEMPPAPAETPFPGLEGKPFAPFAAPEVDAQSMGAASFSLGQPGTVFRYVQTFGVTREPFIETNDHFYWVEGIGTVGNAVWIGDTRAHRVVKFDVNGNFLQQIGKAGVIDYTGTSLDYLTDVAVDSSGNIWVVDGGAAHVVKYDSSGNRVSELGQAWNRGSDNSHFNDPISIAFDSAGNIYVSDTGLWGDDYGNHRVQVFDSSGTYLTTIGQTGVCGTGNNQFCGPRHIAIYSTYLYVADAGNHRVQIFDITNPSLPSHVATLGVTGGPGSDNNHFNHPQGVAVDASYIYVADTENHRVQIFNRNTRAYIATIGGSYGTGNNQFKYPTDVAVDAAGNLYVADYLNKRVQQYNSSRVYQRTYGTTGVSYVAADDRFYYPEGIAVAPDGSIYVVEGHGHRLVKLNANGVPQWTFGEAGQPGNDDAHFAYLRDVAVDPQGRVYVVDDWGEPWINSSHRLRIFNSDGTPYGSLGGYGSDNYHFIAPRGIAIDRNGYVYIADSGNHRVQIYTSQLVYVATLGETGVAGSDNAHFDNPFDVAVDGIGTIYVADEGNDRVQVFNSSRQYVRTIGETGVTGNDFGHFNGWGPHHLAVDSQGRLYVADTGNHRVQVFDNFANGNAYLTTIGGNWGTQAGRFSNLMGIAIGPDDAVYTTEIHNNHRIQKFAPGVPGWRQVNINGFGERANRISSLAPFGGYLYAGTYKFADHGAQIWRMDASGAWTPVMTNGFGVFYNVGIDHLLEFNGKLYAGVWNSTPNPPYTDTGGEIWRSSNGTNWEAVMQGGFGDRYNGEVMRLATFNGQLYAGTWSYTTTHGAEIWRSDTGDLGSWSRVVSNGLGDASNEAVLTMEEFNGALYAGTYSWGDVPNGADIWRTTDGLNWTAVITNGFGYTGTYAVSSLEPFGDYLYAGIGRRDPSTWSNPGGQIWRCSQASGCDEPADWQEVTGGWAKPENYSIDSLLAFDGYLYAVASNYTTGVEVWRTADGTTWEQVGFAGLGDSNNSAPYWDNSAAVFNNRLYIGTTNWANGGEVWLYLHRQVFLPLVLRNSP